MTGRRFTKADLVDEFHRVRGSGIAENEVERRSVARALRRSLRAYLKTQANLPPARPRFDPAVPDHKRRQANDLD